MHKDKISMGDTPSSGGLQPVQWLVLIAFFLLPGIVGHDPWKQDETYSFGIIYHFYTTHSWLIPINAGVPFMEKPPLYYWTAVLFCKIFSGILPLHDAARLTSVLYMALASMCVWKASRVLFHDYAQCSDLSQITLALFLGSLGLIPNAHNMFTDTALLGGTALTFLGVVLLICKPKQWIASALALGLGMGIVFLSKGFLVPVILSGSGLVLLALLPQLRVWRTLGIVLLAFLIASPFLFVWPTLLYLHSPQLFTEWFWNNNVGRFLGFTTDRLGAGNKPGYILYAMLWFAFPIFPLAFYALCKGYKNWRKPEYCIPLSICAFGFVLLLSSASARALYILPLLPAMAVLATQALIYFPAYWLNYWNIAVRILASITALVIITMWICLWHPSGPQPFAKFYGEWLPLGFLPEGLQIMASLCALCLMGLWLYSFRLNARSAVNTAVIWLTAMAMLWGLVHMLLLPWLDETRSFRPVIAQLNEVVSKSPYVDDCIARFNLGESVSPMWQYFGKGRGMGPLENFSGTSCHLLLLMTGKSMPPISTPHWHKIWQGSRLLDSKDELQLYERN